MSCKTEILKGSATGINPIILSLIPGVEQKVSWDFTECGFGIQNFTVYVNQPRNKRGVQHVLPSSTKLTVTGTNLTKNTVIPGTSFICSFGFVTKSKVEVSLLLDASVKKPLNVEVSYTAAFGGVI